MVNKILLLVRKNLLLRKRHFIVTTFEILFPTFMVWVLVYTNAKLETGPEQNLNGVTFEAMTEESLHNAFRDAFPCRLSDPCTFAYAPDNTQTKEVIDALSVSNVTTNLAPDGSIDWKAFNSEKDIEAYLADVAFDPTNFDDLEAAVVFESGLDLGVSSTSGVISYKIRLLNRIRNTDLLFPKYQEPGPDTDNALQYAESGFSYMQLRIETVLAKRLTGQDFHRELTLQAFPYPSSKTTKNFTRLYFDLLPDAIVIGFVIIVIAIAIVVVSEKETGIRELQKLNGVRGWMQWLGWMLDSILFFTISVTLVVILLFIDFGSGALFVYGDPTVWWFVLMLYIISGSAFCFFVCSFFNKTSLAITFGIILWLVTYFFPEAELGKVYDTSSLASKLAYAFLPNMAIGLACRAMAASEGKAKGISWTNIWEPINSVDSLTLGHMIVMFLVDTVLYMSLTVYLENVLPSKFGVRKPWYYIFQLSTYVKSKPNGSVVGPAIEFDNGDKQVPGFEVQESNADVGIDIQNLEKRFGSNKVAVDGVSIKMYDGEIFALLGHNGAGKTTMISMLTGMFAPSSGTAKVNGHDITTALDKARDSLGLCPQHNMLFNKLTVREHLRFFGMLKGLSSSAASNEMKMLLPKLQLAEKAKTISSKLSGGQMRKLCLGNALIGNSKVLILDEPTSGLDPEARRVIWDLLLEMRGQRTILLTTHFMEEADVLGDRLGIMTSGKLSCCGSSAFLKKYYGAGYTLKLSVSKGASREAILLLIQKHVQDASMKASHSNKAHSSEMHITLPTESANTAVLSEMFAELTMQKNELGITAVGMSLTTMDEVFVRVGELADRHNQSMATTPASSKATGISALPTQLQSEHGTVADDQERITKEPTEEGKTERKKRLTGLRLAISQFHGLVTKKYIYAYRKWKLFLAQLIIPSILLASAVSTSRSFLDTPDPPPALKVTLDSYNNLVTLASSTDPAISSDHFSSVIGSSYKPVPDSILLSRKLLNVGRTSLADYREKYIVAFEVSHSKINAMFNTIPNHAAPLALNLATNILLKSHDPTRDLSIRATNHPLQSKVVNYLIAANPNHEFKSVIPFLFGVFMPIGLGLLAASFIVFPIEEKNCKAKQLQMMTGVRPLTYWISAFVFDYILLFLVVCVMITCFPIFQSYGIFTTHGGAGVAFVILMVYGFSAIIFSYLFSLYARTVAGGIALVALIHIISGVSFGFIVYVLEIFGTIQAGLLDTAARFRWAGRLFPTFGATMSTMRYTEIASKNGKCNLLSDEAKDFLCSPKFVFLPPSFRECCENCKALGVSCFKPITYISWIYKLESHYHDGPPSLGPVTPQKMVELPGIAQELFFMLIMALIYLTVLMILEYRIVQSIFEMICQSSTSVFADTVRDDDVMAEANRVEEMVKNGNVNEDALVVKKLCKSYGSFAAVSNLSFGVHHGECFGLLGVNGAGKTTTFRMLTGDETRSAGNVYAFMKSLDEDRIEFLSNIGYCPQFDGIVGVLSGKQMVQLFGRLRGVPGNAVSIEADTWLEKLGLLESANVQCEKYSGGMKRRLGVAMAMIGEPQILLLDEPTSGVDPVSKLQFWNILDSVREAGQSIILTSHSMEECEALCSRLGIMVNGQLQCIGGVQHLKHKFAQGYSLSLKLKPSLPPHSLEQNLDTLKKEIDEKFYPCTLKDIHQNVFQYQLHNTALAWDVVFKTMEDLKQSYSELIEDYSLNESSLEEVFLAFARNQYGARKTNESKLMLCLKCKC